jgi:hypothetical protein
VRSLHVAASRPNAANQASQISPCALAAESVLLLLHVDSTDTGAIRQSLHRALGKALGIYVVAVDYRRCRTSLQIETPRRALGDVMATLIAVLPAAEFGAVRPRRRA